MKGMKSLSLRTERACKLCPENEYRLGNSADGQQRDGQRLITGEVSGEPEFTAETQRSDG
jgi:hypothetical protein